MRTANILGAAFIGILLPTAMGQTGVLDQASPHSPGPNTAQFNVGVDFLLWQQQIRCGVAGQLEGVRLTLSGPQNAGVNIRIRNGAAWSGNPVLFDQVVVKTTPAPDLETLFVDMQSANISLAAGDVFVMEVQGHEELWMIGSYVAEPAEPLYPEPLYLIEQLFTDDQWRLGFDTFMLTGGTPCPGDFNHDSQVGLSDLTILLAHFGSLSGAGPDDGDMDGDGDVDLNDLTAFLSEFGTIC